MRVGYSIIIPVKRDNRVFKTIPLIETYISPVTKDYEILVVGTLANPDRLPRKVRFIKTSGEKGLNIVTGIENATRDYVVWLDADCPVSEFDFRKLLGTVERFDIVIAARRYTYTHKYNSLIISYRHLRTNLFRRLVNIMFPCLRGLDTQAGLKAMKTTIAQNILLDENEIRFKGLAFDLDLLLRARQKKMHIECVQVDYVHSENSVIRAFPSSIELIFCMLILKYEQKR